MKAIAPDLLYRHSEPAPRYTSYPTVMYWKSPPAEAAWTGDLSAALALPSAHLGLYVHIPFCQALCSFCGCNIRVVRNHALAQPYVETVLREFARYRERLAGAHLLIGELHLGGGSPTFLPAQVLDRLLDGILQHCEVARDADLAIEADPRNTTREQLLVLRQHGFTRLSLGVQDFDPRVLEIVNRAQSVETVQRVVDWARELGFTSISFDLIHGLPLQTVESLRHTLDITEAMRPERISFLPYAHVPWIKSSQRQYTEADLPERRVRSQLFALGREHMAAWGMVEIGLDQYARANDPLAQALAAGKLHRNFMGFTASVTQVLIGLGVSAISHGSISYAQNEKSLQQYEVRVTANELPLQRGHVLSADDLRIRAHLWDLLCASRTIISAPERSLQWWRQTQQCLQALQADDLVHLHDEEVAVTETGRAFLRSICAALDPHQQALALPTAASA
ncbi:MAG TPA: oxygen-independent coproporphyrinogen III oxidase [Steroidobacteraceae bacterium]|nr:oxygen-independent coproporphyrinogen III oxidase [Steroidobacteraceae bacterium]